MKHNDDSGVVKAAKHLLANRDRHTAEGNVQSDIEALLRALDVGSIESHYQTGDGEADIYLPNRRAFIECKANRKGHALDPEKPQGRKSPESPREQVERYVHAEIKDELQNLIPMHGVSSNAPWTAIVTDGTHWHIYRYAHELNAACEPVDSSTFHNQSENLVELLARTLGSESLGKEWIPQKPGSLYSDLKAELDELHQALPTGAKSSTATKMSLWLDMMKVSGMVPNDEHGRERLFIAHSFLIVVVRMVSHTLTGSRRMDEWKSTLKDGFASWVLDFHRGESWAERVWKQTNRYDWSRRRGDVLRDLYHEYVPKEDRKVFGEYYTPDWLATMMVEEVLDDSWIEHAAEAALNGECDGIGVLDPACGSGTFLYHAARRILQSPTVRSFSSVEQANVVARLVNGMDIHPVAVEIARVNIERALPAEPSDGSSAFRVFLGDSLQTPTLGTLFSRSKDAMLLMSPGGREAHVPIALVEDPSFAETMRRMVNAAAEGKPLPPDLGRAKGGAALKTCHKQLVQIIKKEGNSVWTWYAVNLAGPHLLAERKIDRVVANPPWVRLSDIQVEERKRAMEGLGLELGLQAGGKQAPHLDIASYFVLRTRELYAADPDRNPASWLVKKSAIRSGQWARFRNKHAGTLAQSVDLEALNPFDGGDATRCCLLMEHRPMRDAPGGSLSARRIGRRPSTHEVLTSARGKFELVEAPEPVPQAPSPYYKVNIKQGATIVPHVLALIASSKAGKPGWTHVETRASRHSPWTKVQVQKGQVPAKWVRPMHTSPDMLPYKAIREPPCAIIPIAANGELHNKPGDECRFWSELNELYDVHKGRGRQTPRTLIDQFDYAGKLSAQPTRQQRGRRMVLYPSSADIMRAARTHAGVAVVDATLYWLVASTEAEAGYLVALLNARCLRRAFSECRESGRDFHLHPWRKVPIPRYDRSDERHTRLAKLCATAERVVERRVAEKLAERPDLKQQGLSVAARQAVLESKAGREIEDLAAQLLPDQAD